MSNALNQGLGSVLFWLWVAQMAFKLFVLIDAAFRKESAYAAAGKMTKPGWLIILCVVLATSWFLGGTLISIFTIIGLVVAIVYMVDVRPALKQVSGKGTKNGQHMGPYGPW